jgi:ribonuclease P protein component
MTSSITGKFPASLKLKSEKRIDLLFKKGKSHFKFPVKIQYLISDIEEGLPSGIEIGVSVSKKRFKRAVDRNLLKRRMRESVRGVVSPIQEILKTKRLKVYVMVIFVGNALEELVVINKAIKFIFLNLQKEIIAHEGN